MRDIAGVLFDLDGTLVNSEDLHLGAWNRTLAGFGLELPDGWNAAAIGVPDIVTAERMSKRYPDLLPGKDEINNVKQNLYRRLVMERGRDIAYPGVEEVVLRLAAEGIGTAVGTNSDAANTETALAAAGLLDYFPVRVTLDAVARGKPDPEIYVTAARLLGLAPERCAVIEDSVSGVAAGRAAGCLTLAVTTTSPASALAEAERFFPDTPSAVKWILERTAKGGAA